MEIEQPHSECSLVILQFSQCIIDTSDFLMIGDAHTNDLNQQCVMFCKQNHTNKDANPPTPYLVRGLPPSLTVS